MDGMSAWHRQEDEPTILWTENPVHSIRFKVRGPPDTMNANIIPPNDLFLYAQSFHKAAKSLAASLQPDADPLTEFDLSPVVFMYRHALKLHLKAIVLGEGGNFLATKPDTLSIHKTHSVSWLAQFVCQIVTALKWQKEFRCEGIDTLSEFKAVVEQLSAVDPGSCVFRLPVSTELQDAVPGGGKSSIREFARRMDALLELLDSIADALAATWDTREEAARIEVVWNGGGVEPPIQ
jgi:hypothetical protein